MSAAGTAAAEEAVHADQGGGSTRLGKDLFSGAMGGIAQVLIGEIVLSLFDGW